MMTESEIFNSVRDLPVNERDEYLARVCGDDLELTQRIRQLLKAHEAAGGAGDTYATLAPDSADRQAIQPSDAEFEMEPTRSIGPYKLLQPLGKGGMGEVWLAQQSQPVKREVALKLIQSGIGSREIIARFDAERQALALMNHPNIARILDAGTTADGQPFFVMELVPGVPLTTYCDQNRLSIDDRLKLFSDVCSGVQHAHQKGIIHRDLKPGNIIIGTQDGKPVPKIIDFGLAKAMEATQRLTDQSLFTGIGQVLGTLKYMSPEQASLDTIDIDTRTDIYALGVILYELLTGSTPLDDSSVKGQAALKVLEFIRDNEPVKPSSKLSTSSDEQKFAITGQRRTDSVRLNRVLAGDLDWIVMKAMERDRARRYESASGFAADIQRYLSSEPVVARPPSLNYRVRKFVRKNRAGVIAASLVSLALIGGIIGTTLGLFRAIRAEQRTAQQKTLAEENEKQAIDAVKRFADSVIENPELKNNPALEELRKALLQEPLSFFKSLRERLHANPDTSTESLERLADGADQLGHLTNQIGDKEKAIQAYQEALEIWERLVAVNPTINLFQSDLATCQRRVGVLLSDTGKPDEAFTVHERGKGIWERLVAANPNVTEFQCGLANSQISIGKLLDLSGKATEALEVYEQARAIQEQLVDSDPTIVDYQYGLAISHNNIGALLARTGDTAEALTAFDHAREIRERLVAANPTDAEFQNDLANSHINMGNLLSDTGKPSDALVAYERATRIQERLVAAYPTVTEFQSALATCHNSMGLLLIQTGNRVDALAALERAHGSWERLVAANPTVAEFQSRLGGTLNNLALIKIGELQFDRAKEYLHEAIRWQKKARDSSPTHPIYRMFLKNHYSKLRLVAGELKDLKLQQEAEHGLAELATSDPRTAAQERRLKELLDGDPSASANELLDIAMHAYDMRRFSAAARFWDEAMQMNVSLRESRKDQHAYNGACAAALAAGGQGSDAPDDEAAQAELRADALFWLTGELDRWQTFLESAAQENKDEAAAIIAQTLEHWESDSDLNCIREAAELEKLSTTEREKWKAIWKHVAELKSQAGSVGQNEKTGTEKSEID